MLLTCTQRLHVSGYLPRNLNETVEMPRKDSLTSQASKYGDAPS